MGYTTCSDDQLKPQAQAASYEAMRHRYREDIITQVMDDRDDWEQATEHSRRLAKTLHKKQSSDARARPHYEYATNCQQCP